MKPHEILGVPPDATLAEARQAYKRLAMKFHPDRNGGDTEAFQRLQRAMERFVADRNRPFDDIFKDVAAKARRP